MVFLTVAVVVPDCSIIVLALRQYHLSRATAATLPAITRMSKFFLLCPEDRRTDDKWLNYSMTAYRHFLVVPQNEVSLPSKTTMSIISSQFWHRIGKLAPLHPSTRRLLSERWLRLRHSGRSDGVTQRTTSSLLVEHGHTNKRDEGI